MKNQKLWVLLWLISFLIVSCKIIIEPSLSKRDLVLQAPTDGYQTTNYNVGFWWDELEDALSYRLQIVTPTFASPGSLILDTLVKTNKFNQNLIPGDYQWRVQAVNGSSQSTFAGPRSFSVFESSITKQSVQLITPANTFVTNSTTQIFQWGSLFGATKYRFQIDTNNFVNDTSAILNQVISGQQLNYNFPKDQSYRWRVRAENDTAVSRWSVVNQILFDRTPPQKVILNNPADGENIPKPINMTWGVVSTATRYKLYLLKSDSTSAYNGTFPLIINSNAYNFDLGDSGEKVFWKVAAIDAAGNEGVTSQLRSFVIR